MKNTFTLTFILSLFLFPLTTIAQNAPYSIYGQLVEKNTNNPMEYCTVSLYNTKDSSLVTGTISENNGNFSLAIKQAGNYYLQASFIGFSTQIISNINLNSKQKSYNAKTIVLASDAKQVSAVEITGTRNTVRYELDKKVVNVDKNITAQSETAVEVLSTVPSVDVSADGTVSLRGKSNFLVLIDGKPTTLEASQALQQIPASNIKNIEIITNPSAKYEAENTAGIINVVLKKAKKLGTSGLVTLGVGTFKNYNAGVNIKHNIKKFNFEFSGNFREHNSPYSKNDSTYTQNHNNRFATTTKGEESWNFGGLNLNYGMGYQINENHSVDFDIEYGKWWMRVDRNQQGNKANLNQNILEQSKNISDSDRGAPYFGPSLSYAGKFKNKSTLNTYVGYSRSRFSEKVLNHTYTLQDSLTLGSQTTEKSLTNRVTAKIDFSLPIKSGKLELGAKSKNVWDKEANKSYALNLSNQNFDQNNFGNYTMQYQRAIYGLYTSYANKYKKFSYSLGFRAEYTDRSTKVVEKNTEYNYFKWNYFPTVHFAYNISETHQVYASYATRIRRPSGWQIEPNTIKTGVNSFFSGNPNLKPTISYSAELGWSKSIKKKSTLSIEAFYKYNQDIKEFITTSIGEGNTLMQPNNVGNAHNIGLEASLSTKPLKWWSINLMANSYYNIYRGQFKNQNFDSNRFQWSARMNNFFNITKTTSLQFSGRYNSRRTTALGFSGYNLNFDLGLKQSFLKRSLNLSLNVQNILSTSREFGENNVNTDYFYSYSSTPKYPMLKVNISYTINNYRRSYKQKESAQGDY